MPLRTTVILFFSFLATTAFAQNDTSKIKTDGQQIALLEEHHIHPDGIIINPGKKEVNADSLILPLKPVQKATTKIAPPGVIVNAKHPVPLIGQLAYFGADNNQYLIKYCSSYLDNFSRRLTSVSHKTKDFRIIENILAKNHIPKELEYLAVIESALNGNARSPVGAVGYWQFMSYTARRMGLVVNRHRDDRKNLYRSTKAAAKYLNYLYGKYHDWLLVVAAYNCGAGRLNKAIDRAGGKTDFWSVKKYLPKETQNHVLAFIATATIMERLSQYIESGLPANFNWASLDYNHPSQLEINDKTQEKTNTHQPTLIEKFGINEVKKMALVRIDKPLNLGVLSSVLKMNYKKLNKWNYDYYSFVKNYKPGNTYNLRIPKNKLDTYIAQKNYIQHISDKVIN